MLLYNASNAVVWGYDDRSVDMLLQMQKLENGSVVMDSAPSVNEVRLVPFHIILSFCIGNPLPYNNLRA